MAKRTHSIRTRAPNEVAEDPVTRQRLKTGFPEDEGFWMRMVLRVALPALVLSRRQLGQRMVGVFRLIPPSLMSLLWCVLVGVVLHWDDADRFVDELAAGCIVVLVFFLAGIGQRFTRWWMWQRGEKLATLSLGTSWYFGEVPKGNGERYLDGLAVIGIGCLMGLKFAYPVAGSLLVVSGLALLGVESFMHERRLRTRDSLMRGGELDAEAQTFMRENGIHSGKEERIATEVSTQQLDPVLAAMVEQRKSAALPASLPAPQPRAITASPGHVSADEVSAAAAEGMRQDGGVRATQMWKSMDIRVTAHAGTVRRDQHEAPPLPAPPERAGSTPRRAPPWAGTAILVAASIVATLIGVKACTVLVHKPFTPRKLPVTAQKAPLSATALTDPAMPTQGRFDVSMR